ncbi:hypothetical protein [Nocardiopsis sp. NRRL B-16309]|uniref:hypothetical protein n=1 Tax=Nocardiopsis sp. NRRL B-16309 TaxID=1519494 RepID=UPI0006AE8629|nr:hypothetical protein [Nocardiopsis sp. NRRL B-16309]KOX10068.1 hypothetical protein ADL05_25515 [Nocardiopsis sp. NRRL B-16309]
MSRASRPGQSRPTAVIVIAPDEHSAEIVIEGQRQVVTGAAPKETRRAALDVATGHAARIGQPVLVDARDANGYWLLLATPDGVVRAADEAAPAAASPPPPAQPSPQPAPAAATKGQGRSSRGRTLVIAAAAVLALVLLVGAGAVATRFLVGSSTAAGTGGGDGAALGHPAPPGFDDTVVFDEPLAPDTRPGVSREEDLLAYTDPDDRLNLFGADGERRWAVDLPAGAGEFLDAPRFVEYGDGTAVVLETADTLWFWPVEGGEPTSVALPTDATAQYVGDSVLVRTAETAFVPVGAELVEVESPGESAPLVADGERVLNAVVNGPWQWVDTDGGVEEVHARRPRESGEMDAIVTALREYVIVRWEPLQGEGVHLAFHDREDGSAVGGADIDPADLEDVRHRSGPIGTRVVAYGPVVMDPSSGETAVVPGFVPEIAVGDQVFGRLDGAPVAVSTSGMPSDLVEGAAQPEGLLGDNAIVVHDDHLYAIPSQ